MWATKSKSVCAPRWRFESSDSSKRLPTGLSPHNIIMKLLSEVEATTDCSYSWKPVILTYSQTLIIVYRFHLNFWHKEFERSAVVVSVAFSCRPRAQKALNFMLNCNRTFWCAALTSDISVRYHGPYFLPKRTIKANCCIGIPTGVKCLLCSFVSFFFSFIFACICCHFYL